MKFKNLCVLALLLACAFSVPSVSRGQSDYSGLALVVVYDTSASMAERVMDSAGVKRPKYQIASEALGGIVEKIDAYSKTYPVEAGLVSFRSRGDIAMGKWNRAPFQGWLASFREPDNNTPLGEAIAKACSMLQSSKIARKHIVILTDGESNGSLAPDVAIREARKMGATPQIHVVAFDVNASVFGALKKEGVDVLPASGITLERGLKDLFAGKILLEAE